ncbi:MAG: hypothetical protein AAGB93_21510, partial [Planctomycetota bacterium]
MLHRTLSLATLGIASSGLAAAQGGPTDVFVDIGSILDGAGVPSNTHAGAGPMGGGTWNALDMDLIAGPVYVTPPLLNSSGAPTGVTLQWDGLGLEPLPWDFNEPNTFGDDQALMDDAGYLSGPSTFTFQGLAPGLYDVVTYAMAPDNATFFTNVDVVGAFDPPQDVGGDFAAGYVQGVTHAKHTVAVDMSGEIVININVAANFDTVNGIQVFESGGGGIGTSYCGPAVPNSSGASAVITLTGSPIVSLNSVTATVNSMPTAAFGFFLASQTQGFIPQPGGSLGNLCLGGSIGRYVGPGQIQ